MTRILVLEDDEAVAESMVRALEMRGIEVVLAGTVADAIRAYEVDGFDVIVLDYEVPDGTGLDFLARIRRTDRATTVLYSGLDRSREIAAAGLYVDRQISKGDPVALLELIEGRA